MSKLFFGGIPTAPDVKKLREAFPRIEDGTDFTHEQIQAVIGLHPKSARYRGVTLAWRKEMLKDHNIEIAAVAAVGFRALTGPERIESNIKGFKHGARKQGKHLRRVGMVPSETLAPSYRDKQTHFMRLGAAVLSQAGAMMKELEPPRAQPQISHQRPLPGR